jgi:hypothetical protein
VQGGEPEAFTRFRWQVSALPPNTEVKRTIRAAKTGRKAPDTGAINGNTSPVAGGGKNGPTQTTPATAGDPAEKGIAGGILPKGHGGVLSKLLGAISSEDDNPELTLTYSAKLIIPRWGSLCVVQAACAGRLGVLMLVCTAIFCHWQIGQRSRDCRRECQSRVLRTEGLEL